ncbi:MAG: hypothetical protein M9896_19015 [Candidatus Promineofilum sp.]|uniref:hypothetical protein n=1 Tax=Promineifilum sp. TaxID=2664178 RepID=UPI002411EAC6|nr:hypothetical protein [Promineifilum sp.]
MKKNIWIFCKISSSVTSVYREHPQLTDFDVERVYDALIKEYSRPEGSESAPPEFPTEERAALYAQAKIVCDFRGRPGQPASVAFRARTGVARGHCRLSEALAAFRQ